MTVDIRQDDYDLLERLVAAGRFTSATDAIHEALQQTLADEPPTAEYLAYVNDAIEEGLADVDAGRTVSAEQFFAELRRHRLQQA